MTTPCRARGRAALARTGVALAVAAVLVAGCGATDKEDSSDASTTTAAKAATTTTAGDRSTTTAKPGDTPPWDRDAQEHQGKDGKRFSYDCPAGGTASTVWGTELYTDDSSVCTAAVQVGLITFDEGGKVEIEIAPGEDSYQSGTAHGVTSESYASWGGSFFFPAAAPGTGDFEVSPRSWNDSATNIEGDAGTKASVRCSPGGTPSSVWGSGPYTADSSVCSAAVHAGLITVAEGGTVQIEIAAGEDNYKGSTANGITTSDYGAYDRSFTFPSDQPLQ